MTHLTGHATERASRGMDRMLLDVPPEVPTRRLVVRCSRAGDGPVLHAAATRNRSHLARFEAGNILLTAD